MIRRERKVRPAIVNPSATLHRPHHFDALILFQRDLVPQPARHHLTVERDGHAAALARRPGSRHRLAHGGVRREIAALAVQQDPHATALSKRSARNGSTVAGGSSPVTRAATAAEVIGASSTPLRWCPVAQTTPSRSPISGALSGVPGRRRAAASTNSSSATS